jgi:hypothetical protein
VAGFCEHGNELSGSLKYWAIVMFRELFSENLKRKSASTIKKENIKGTFRRI